MSSKDYILELDKSSENSENSEIYKNLDQIEASLRRSASELVFKNIKLNNFTPTDIDYVDGYFICSYGDYSVVHFHIKECPNWKFAIWWGLEDYTKENRITGEFFCQYEPELDKFKPSRSEFVRNISFELEPNPVLDELELSDWHLEEGETCWPLVDIIKVFKFIHKCPLRAWAYSWCGYDYRVEDPSKVLILAKYLNYRFNRFKRNLFYKVAVRKQLRFIRRYIIPWFQEEFNPELIELKNLNEEDPDPRFHDWEIQVKISDNSELDTGCYGWWSDDPEDLYSKKLEIKWNRLKKRIDKASDLLHVWWHGSIDDCMVIWKQREYDERLKEFELEDA